MKRLLITGASGYLGRYLLREAQRRGLDVVAWSGAITGEAFGVRFQPVDLANNDQIVAAFREAAPQAVIHAGAMASVADCFQAPQRAQRINVEATALLTQLAAHANARLAFVSTDLVFDGIKGHYREEDEPRPLSVYGRTKYEAERIVLATSGNAVLRLSLLFGSSLGGESFFDRQLAALQKQQPVKLFEDEWRTPLSLPTAARALVEFTLAHYSGLLHLGGPERMSRLAMGQRLAGALKIDPSSIVACQRDSVPAGEPRPRDTSLDSSRFRQLFPNVPWPSWNEAFRGMLAEFTSH